MREILSEIEARPELLDTYYKPRDYRCL